MSMGKQIMLGLIMSNQAKVFFIRAPKSQYPAIKSFFFS